MAQFESFNSELTSAPFPKEAHIRPAKGQDLLGIASLYAERNETTMQRAKQVIRRTLPKGYWVVALDFRNQYLGYGRCIYFKPPEGAPENCVPEGWYLLGMIVAPHARRQNIGLKLTQYRMTWLKQRSQKVYYFANSLNLASIALHSKLGFKAIHSQIWFPGVTFSKGGSGTLFIKEFE